MEITEKVFAKNRQEWRQWLEKNHGNKKEIWLVYYKKSSNKETISYEDAVLEAICFGWIDSIEKSIDSESFAGRFTPRRPQSHWTDTNIERYKKLLRLGKVTKAGREAFEKRK